MLLASGHAAAATVAKKKPESEAAVLADLAKKIDALVAQNQALSDKVAKLEAAQSAQATQVNQQAAVVKQQSAQVQAQAPPSPRRRPP